MFKYQEEIFNELEQAVFNIQDLTDEQYHIRIGYGVEDELVNQLGRCEIYVHINDYNGIFNCGYNLDGFDDYAEPKYFRADRVYLYDDVFKRLNKLIDKIIKDNKKRDEFHENLLNELKAFNKSLTNVGDVKC